MENEKVQKIEQLCRSSISAAITKLCEVRTWPRPPRARKLRVGYDFYRNELQDIQEVNSLITHLLSDDTLKSIYCDRLSSPELGILYEYWEQLLLKILRETNGTSLTNRVFKKWFRRFLKELYSETAVWRSVDTITGLTMNATKLVFDNATVLTSISGFRLGHVIWGEDWYTPDAWSGVGLDKATIVTTVSIPKREYSPFVHPPPSLTKHIERHLSAIEAIWLTKSGAPRIHCHVQFQLSDFPVAEPFAYCKHEGEPRLYENKTVLNRSDFKTVRTLWQERMSTRNLPRDARSNAMDTAYERFFRAYSRNQNWFDTIVDLAIALESLFSPDERQELKHRISLRAAWLLSSDEQVDQDTGGVSNRIYNLVRTIYDIRSSRVHGGMPKESEIRKWIQTLSGVEYDQSKDSQLLELALESARELVRKAIMACLKLSKLEGAGPKWPFPEGFDENIISAGQRYIWQKAAGIRR